MTRNFADDRTRTSTLLLRADFESAVSTISPHRLKLRIDCSIEKPIKAISPIFPTCREIFSEVWGFHRGRLPHLCLFQ